MFNREDAKHAKKKCAPGRLRFPVALAPGEPPEAAVASDDVVLFSPTARKSEALSSSGLRGLRVFAVQQEGVGAR
jgi:hypothetical protein